VVVALAHQVATGSKISGRQSWRLLWESSKPLSGASAASGPAGTIATLATADRLLWLKDHHAASLAASGILPAPGRLRSGIAVRDLSFTYPGTEREVLSTLTLTLTLPAGATVAIVGENGSGKTTLVKLLLGMFFLRQKQSLRDHAPAGSGDSATIRANLARSVAEDHGTPTNRRNAVKPAAAITTTGNGARRHASTPATSIPAGRAHPANPCPAVSADVAASAISSTVAASANRRSAAAGTVTRPRSSGPASRNPYVSTASATTALMGIIAYLRPAVPSG
jgi:energy-coupling factor transporter ATP-binding protein EcfA2